MANDDSRSLEELTEDLTVQQVILDSLESADFEDVEAARVEARKEIDKLSRFIRVKRRQPQQRTLSGEGESAASNQESAHAMPECEDVRPVPSRLAAGAWEPEGSPPPLGTPRQSAKNITAMDTHLMEHDIWSSPRSQALPSRKRDFSTAALRPNETSAKRQTTPTPGAWPSSLSAWPASSDDAEFVDIVDLTRDDIEDQQSVLARQREAAKRYEIGRRQEETDREMAMRLSQATPAPTHATPSTGGNAFARLMATERSNAPPDVSTTTPDPVSSVTGRSALTSLCPNLPVTKIPGAYDPSWDEEKTETGASQIAATNRPIRGPTDRDASTQRLHQVIGPSMPQSRRTELGEPSSMDNHSPSAQRSRSTKNQAGTASTNYTQPGWSAPLAAQPASSHSIKYESGGPLIHFNNPLSMSVTTDLQVPRATGPDSLSNIINRTSGIDYASGRDMFGNPLSDRLTSFIEDTYYDPRVTEQELDDLLKNIRPDMDIPEKNRDGTPAGLKSTLYHHQELALTWMKKMEEGSNKGGILADDMGLGKTISTLALILSRPGTSRPKTNLIIGPVALIRQWEEEISKKTKPSHRLSCFIYHNKKTTTQELLRYDVVLTTYGTVAQELKRLDKYLQENKDRKLDYNDRNFAVKCPLLHPEKAVFHRIILDEAQCIKNENTRTAKACHQLRSTYRWCLTGTPMMNGVTELYSLLKFLKIKPYCSWDQFRGAFGRLFGAKRGESQHVAMRRLRALLKAIMLRRKKDSTLEGKPILRLPKKTEHIIHVELSRDERDFYDQLEKQSRVQFSSYLREGTVGQNYSTILVLLLRLRQACCHPHLNLDVVDTTPATSEELIQLVSRLEPSIVRRIKDTEAFECPICYDVVQSPSFFFPCGHESCSQCLAGLAGNAAMRNIQAGSESSGAICPVCRSPFDPRQCFSFEAFQKVHMPASLPKNGEDANELVVDDSEADDESGDDYESDEEVNHRGDLRGFVIDDDPSSDDENERRELGDSGASHQSHRHGKRRKNKSRNKGKKKTLDVKASMLKILRHESNRNREAFRKYMAYLRKTWLPAAKVTECMRLLEEIGQTSEKTIVFSQWTLLLDLLEVAMWHHGGFTKPRRYDGTMSADERSVASMAFRDRDDVNVLLVSLRAGNAGLNLTAASRVIIMDPFWNPYIEMQAVDRAHRIGQKREVQVYRILTQSTVEDRIEDLKEKKKEVVEAALDETEGMKIGRLSINELKYLFFNK